MQIYLENEGTTKISDIYVVFFHRKVLSTKDSLAKRNWQVVWIIVFVIRQINIKMTSPFTTF
jgi:hypothetical protein